MSDKTPAEIMEAEQAAYGFPDIKPDWPDRIEAALAKAEEWLGGREETYCGKMVDAVSRASVVTQIQTLTRTEVALARALYEAWPHVNVEGEALPETPQALRDFCEKVEAL